MEIGFIIIIAADDSVKPTTKEDELEEMKKEIFDFSEALRRMKEGKKVRRVIWEECGAYIHIVSKTIIAVCDGNFFPCVFKDSEDILATDWEEV